LRPDYNPDVDWVLMSIGHKLMQLMLLNARVGPFEAHLKAADVFRPSLASWSALTVSQQ